MSQNLTPQQQQFCQHYLQSNDASAAYRQAYKSDSLTAQGIAAKAQALLQQDKVQQHLQQLRTRQGILHGMSIEALLAELEQARQLALDLKIHDKPQISSAISATLGKAKLLGLDKQLFDCNSTGETVEKPTIIELVAPHGKGTN